MARKVTAFFPKFPVFTCTVVAVLSFDARTLLLNAAVAGNYAPPAGLDGQCKHHPSLHH